MPLLKPTERYEEQLPATVPQAVSSGAPSPGALDTLAASFRQGNIVSSLYEGVVTGRFSRRPQAQPGYDPLGDIAGFEDYAHRFFDSESAQETANIKRRIGFELADKQVIAQAGGWGLASSIASGVVDPVTLASMAIPVAGATTRGAAIMRAVGTQVALDTVSEALFHATQETRTAEQSVINIGASAIMTGIVGAAIAGRIPRGELDKAIRTVNEELNEVPAEVGSTVGAAARGAGTTLAEEGVSGWAARAITSTVGKVSLLGRLITSPSRVARQTAQELAEVPFALTKNERGVATPIAVESMIKRYDATIASWATRLDKIYNQYRTRVTAAGEAAINFRNFKAEVSAAMRRLDESGVPEIAQAAKIGRSAIIEPLKKELQAVGLLPEEVVTVGADSYLPRLYDVQKIKAQRSAWESTLRAALMGQGAELAEINTAIQEITANVLGTLRGFVHLDPHIVVKAGPLKQRTLTVPDRILEPFLVNDIERVMTQYVRSVAPQLEMARKFGDVDMKQQLQNLADEYAVLQTRATSDKTKAALEARAKADYDDLIEVRDRLLGKAGIPANPDSALVRGARLVRQYNYVRLLGGQALSSLADVGRIITQYGMTRTAKGLGAFATQMSSWKVSREFAKRLGIGLDWTLNTRGATLAEIGEFAETSAEQYAQKASAAFSRITGMATWNSSMKFLATALQQDQVLDWATRASISASRQTQLAALGIDAPMLARIRKMYEAHGVDEGLRRARTELWKDKEAALTFEVAMLKGADTAVLTKGVADTPKIMSTELAKTLLQFKGFGIAAVNRLVVPMAQGFGRGDLEMLNGLQVMLAMGLLRYATKQWTADQPIETDPKTVIREAIDGAGLSTFLMEPYDVFAGMTGLPRASRFTDRSWIETAAGPTAGTITDLGRTIEDLAKDGVSQRDIHKLRKLMPGQNLFYLRRAINAMEEGTGDALGVSE